MFGNKDEDQNGVHYSFLHFTGLKVHRLQYVHPFIASVGQLYWFCASSHGFGRVHMKGDIYGAFDMFYDLLKTERHN
jgi:hypothetical protein